MARGQKPLRHLLKQMPPPHLWPSPKMERTFLARLLRLPQRPHHLIDRRSHQHIDPGQGRVDMIGLH